MTTLGDRFSEGTIPEHGSSGDMQIQIPLVGFPKLEQAFSLISDAFRSLGELLAPLDDDIGGGQRRPEIELKQWIERRCAGHIRRQARVRR